MPRKKVAEMGTILARQASKAPSSKVLPILNRPALPHSSQAHNTKHMLHRFQNNPPPNSMQVTKPAVAMPKAPLDPRLIFWGALAVVGAVVGWASQKSKKEKVSGESFAEKNPNYAVRMDELKRAGTGTNQGRSGGYKLERENPSGHIEYFYYKETFNRPGLERELVIGNLGKALFGNHYPRVLLCETVQENETEVRYGLLSEAVSPNTPHSNLYDWSIKYFEDHEAREYGPKFLGACIAFDKLFGKSDCKLANLVGIWGPEGACYSIDHESAFSEAPAFISDPNEAVEYIGEFIPKSLAQYGHEENCPGLNTNDDPDRPLRDKPQILEFVRPIMVDAIKNDISNHHIADLYKKFAGYSEKELRSIINPMGFLSAERENYYMKTLKETQHELKIFLTESKKESFMRGPK